MPDLKNAAKVGSNMNGCLIWAMTGFIVFLGMSIGSAYMVFMGLLVGGAMLGGKAVAGNKKESSNRSLTQYSNKSFNDEDRKESISQLRNQADRSQTAQAASSTKHMSSHLNQKPSRSPTQLNQKTMNDQPSNSDLIAQIERLSELKKKDYLSDEEYSAMKAKLISMLSSRAVNVASQAETSNPEAQTEIELREKTNFSVDDLI